MVMQNIGENYYQKYVFRNLNWAFRTLKNKRMYIYKSRYMYIRGIFFGQNKSREMKNFNKKS